MYVRATVGYWRKANQIHKWFVDNVQDGKDDCGTYYVRPSQLEALRESCILVMAASEMVPDMVVNGQTYSVETGEWRNNLEKGNVILDSKVAQAELPSADGFFFGSTEYDEWYINDLIWTVEIIDKVLGGVARWEKVEGGIFFEKDEDPKDFAGNVVDLGGFDLYYSSSW
jgi:hypothetical protein